MGARALNTYAFFALFYGHVINTGKASLHQTVFGELPIFVAVGAKPLAAVIVPFIFKAHRYAIFGKRPQGFFEFVLVFFYPFPLKACLPYVWQACPP